MDHLVAGEEEMVKQYLHPNSIAFDVGAFDGDWSRMAFTVVPSARIHAFEPMPSLFEKLKENMDEEIKSSSLTPNNCGLSNTRGLSEFWVYEDYPAMSTQHRRADNEMESVGVSPPVKTEIMTVILDDYCFGRGVHHIDFLKIDTEGNEFAVLDGSRRMLKERRINTIQFEYGKCYLDSITTLKMVFDLLLQFGYKIAKIELNEMQFHTQFDPSFETYEYCNYIAVL